MAISFLEILIAISVIVLSIAKSYWLSIATLDLLNFKFILEVFLADYAIILPVLALSLVSAQLNRYLRTTILCLLLFLCLWHLSDTICLILIGTRLHINDILLLLEDLDTLFDVVPLFTFLLVPALFILHWFDLKIRTSIAIKLCLACCLSYLLGNFLIDQQKIAEGRYYSSIKRIVQALKSTSNNSTQYTSAQIVKYKRSEPIGQAAIPKDHPNLIFLIVEALSAIDSFKISGKTNLIPKIDQIAEQGTLFTNVLSNHTHSAGGITGIYHGTPPFNFPGTNAGPYLSYQGLPNTLQTFKTAGYATGILFAVPEDQLQLRRWAINAGFDFLGSPASIDRLKNQPRFVINSVSDRVILEEALIRIKEYQDKKQKFFFSVVTNSSHTPFEHPEGGANTETAIWSYVENQIEDFYNSLKATNFFKDGLLVITGDHRKRTPVNKLETQLFGASAITRSFMILVGKNIKKDKLDTRYIQHSDILPMLSKLQEPTKPLSKYMYFVDQPGTLKSGKYCQEPSFVFLTQEHAHKAYSFCLEGTEINWDGNKPTAVKDIEREIHSRRSFFQVHKQKQYRKACPYIPSDKFTNEQGVELQIYPAADLFSDLKQTSSQQNVLVDNFSFKQLPYYKKNTQQLYSFNTLIKITETDEYKFTLETPAAACLRINDFSLVKDWKTKNLKMLGERFTTGVIKLQKGLHHLHLRVATSDLDTPPYLLLFASKKSQKQSHTISKKILYLIDK